MKAQRSDSGLALLRKNVATLTAKLKKCQARLVEVDKDMLEDVQDQLRSTRDALASAQHQLRAVETADPIREMEVTVNRGRASLWHLEQAIECGDRAQQADALRTIIAHVVIEPVPNGVLRSGRMRFLPKLGGIALRPGSGLDVLAEFYHDYHSFEMERK
jgi:hypothetical protein